MVKVSIVSCLCKRGIFSDLNSVWLCVNAPTTKSCKTMSSFVASQSQSAAIHTRLLITATPTVGSGFVLLLWKTMAVLLQLRHVFPPLRQAANNSGQKKHMVLLEPLWIVCQVKTNATNVNRKPLVLLFFCVPGTQTGTLGWKNLSKMHFDWHDSQSLETWSFKTFFKVTRSKSSTSSSVRKVC